MVQGDRGAVRVGGPPVTPVHKRDQDGVEGTALGGEPVLVPLPLAGLAVGHAPEDALVDETGQPGTQDLARCPDPDMEIVEPAYPVERVTKHEQRPFL